MTREPERWIRLLVDRLWPRGLKKTDARLTSWMKDVSTKSAAANVGSPTIRSALWNFEGATSLS